VQEKRGKASSKKDRRKRVPKRLGQAQRDLVARVKQLEEWDHVERPSPFDGEPKSRSTLIFDLMSDNTTGFVINTAIQESLAARLRLKLLTEVANLQESGIAYFQKRLLSISAGEPIDIDLPSLTQAELTALRLLNRLRFWKVSDGDLLRLRDELRAVWRGASVHSYEAEETIAHWLQWTPSREEVGQKRYSPFSPSLELGRIVMDVKNLHVQIAQAVLDHTKYLKICGNPGCVNPCFVARRVDQKYCEAGGCTDYGHQVAAREHYRKSHAVKESAYRIKSDEEGSSRKGAASTTKTKKGSKNGRQRSSKRR
jgi:hypothetical protein